MRIAPLFRYAVLGFGLGLSGCTTAPSPQEEALKSTLVRDIAPQTREARETIARQDVLTQAAFWAKEYDKNPADKEAALALARIVRTLGNPERAAEVASQALTLYPKDPDLLLVAGQAFVENAQAANALDFLRSAILIEPANWHAHLAMGVAYDQLSKPVQARAAFNRALALQPNNPGILSNLGLNYASDGDLTMAERYLRQAIAQPNAPVQARQNLALVLALQGRFEAANAMASEDLPMEQASKNIDMVRAMIVRPKRWEMLRDE
ncbi:MAG: tetratricopeptide repeat protein [Robiginitomaculum sp.]|nr:tetratricopeptide repeat protein [Robiginitomaculum sp.]MDQ7076516.1 tetratricopeptide repeat protein [Robiginitomaculum sp.]